MKIRHALLLSYLLLMIACAPAMHYPSQKVAKPFHREQIHASLFESDKKEISQEAVNKLLAGVVKFSESIRVAVYKMPNTGSLTYKYYGYSSEERLDTEQEIFKTVGRGIDIPNRIKWVKPLPSILSPSKTTMSKLREAAVRLQADLLVIFSVSSDIFTDYNLFSKNEVKAYATCEMIAFDTKTGIIPFSEVITKKVIEKEMVTDAHISETRKRAEKKAVMETLKKLSEMLKKQIING